MSDSESGKEEKEESPQDVKQEDKNEKEEKEDSKKQSPKKEEKPKENNKKAPAMKKTAKKKEIEEENEEASEGSDDDDDDEEVGLLDRPVEVSGSRERKKVERLELSFTTPSKEKAEIPEGQGEKLGECPRIEFQLQKTNVDELKVLHRILFNRPGSGNEVKKNIRKFSGFPFEKDSAEYERKKAHVDKLTSPVLKHVCEVLDIERGGTKEEILTRIMDFLLKPKPSGKQVSKPKKRGSAKGEKRKRSEKKEKGGKKTANKKKKKVDYSSEELSEEPSDKDDDEEPEENEEEEEEEISDEEPKKKKPKASAPKKKESQVKDKKKEKNGEKPKKAEEKKAPAKAAKKKKDESEDESSDDEPLANKARTPPTDDEIKQLVKKILDDADLEEITMKKVIKQVFDEYPEFDLSEKKDYIKATVKSCGKITGSPLGNNHRVCYIIGKCDHKCVRLAEVTFDHQSEAINSVHAGMGLLDRPVEVSGSRKRKKVERLELSFITPGISAFSLDEGEGEKLGECPRIEFQLQKTNVDELKVLHRILFNRPGSGNEVKKNIRKFSGFPFEKYSAEYERKKNLVDRLKSRVLKHVCQVLDIQRGGTKEEILTRIMDFLLKPKPSGKQVSKPKKQGSAEGEKKKRSEKKEKGGKKTANKKKKKVDYSSEELSEEPSDKDDDEEPEENEEEEEEEISDEEPKKKKAPAKAAKKKKDESEDESSDDELLANKARTPPTDDEIKQLVIKILDDADLEEITMKKVIKQVFDEYPEFDLSEKKDYIKARVNSLIIQSAFIVTPYNQL